MSGLKYKYDKTTVKILKSEKHKTESKNNKQYNYKETDEENIDLPMMKINRQKTDES